MKKIFLMVVSLLWMTGCGSKMEVKNIKVDDFDSYKEGAIILDVRSALEFSNGHIEEAINVDVNQLEEEIETVITDKDAKIIVYCQSGTRSQKASNILFTLGYQQVYNLLGGYAAYQERG